MSFPDKTNMYPMSSVFTFAVFQRQKRYMYICQTDLLNYSKVKSRCVRKETGFHRNEHVTPGNMLVDLSK
ncbi:hypothetical protein Bca101_018616 [Brassica carinata]